MAALNQPIKQWATRRVWIIGASSGIGEACARQWLQAGATVVLSARSEDKLQAIASSFEGAHILPFDAADEQAWPDAVAAAARLCGELDIVLFCAARYHEQNGTEIDVEAVQKSFDLNVVSVYRGVNLIVPRLLRQGSGGIAIVGSLSGYTGLPKAMIYGATKAALINLAQSLYFELAPRGLSVYLINPGFVRTPMTAKNDFKMPGLMSPDEAARAIIAGMEKGRFEIRFPGRLAIALRLISWLPYGLRFPLLHKATGL
ncbi:MAG: SDR family NAD(P)-dependent oxidoreductase [Burkholderiaceae bacterium]